MAPPRVTDLQTRLKNSGSASRTPLRHRLPMPFRRSAKIIETEGIARFLRRVAFSVYRRSVRRILPADGYVMYGGIAVGRARKFLDRSLWSTFLPPDLQDNPTYEQALMQALHATVRSGDKVVVVGGGEGITTALAAMLVGESGSVICYEGDLDGVKAARRTAGANRVMYRIAYIHAVVGPNLGVFGTAISDEVVDPRALPECDILEMDCEGSEVQILSEMVIKPRAVVVETHGFAGSSTARVTEILEQQGYRVEDLGLAEPKEACIGRDEHVLLALHT